MKVYIRILPDLDEFCGYEIKGIYSTSMLAHAAIESKREWVEIWEIDA